MNPRDPMLAAALVAAVAAPLGAQAPMTYEVVDANGPQDPWGKSAGDLDGDGVPELLVQGNGGDLVYYVGPGWAKQTIDAGGSFSTDLEVVRVDADADADVVSIAVGESWR